jgi:23S rRNA pseudouridine1911/1915/1917 synthase
MGATGGRREVLVVADDATGRLDAWLALALDLSRTRVAGLVDEGRVRVDGRVPRKSDPVVAGQRIEVEIPPPVVLSAQAEDLPLDIVFEDASVVVVNKPAGLVVHPSPGHPRGTLVNALLHHVRDLSGIGGALRPGIVHRLDRDTSGLLVVAKDDQAHAALSKALKERRVKRLYLAAAWGHLPTTPMTIEAPVGRHPTDRKRMAVVPTGRAATTHVEVLERWTAAELLRISLSTGRTHQIRVHLEHIGHPVVGDGVYGVGRERGMSGEGRMWARELARRTPRQFLHATELAFDHPRTGELLRFTAPLPGDLEAVAAWAREHGS